MYPLFRVYGAFMDIKRYEHMPYYFYPRAKALISFEDHIINFLDFAVDAHEENRNSEDRNRNFYSRSIYLYNNFLRYQNATMSNIIFDTQATKAQHGALNAVISQQNMKFYMAATATHVVGFMYLSYFFRYRRLSAAPVLAMACAYSSVFDNVNNILYKMFVDKHMLAEARRLGLEAHCQPSGTRKARGFNYL